MKVDRFPGIGVVTLDPRRLTEAEEPERLSWQRQNDALDLEQFAKSFEDEEDACEDQDSSPTPKPFELIPSISPASDPAKDVNVYPSVAQILNETAHALYVSDGYASGRQVSVTLAPSVLPGVTLSVYEHEGRIVGDFTCAEDASRSRLCRFAERLAREMANKLSRPSRVYVRADEVDDIAPFQVDGTPALEPADQPATPSKQPAEGRQELR